MLKDEPETITWRPWSENHQSEITPKDASCETDWGGSEAILWYLRRVFRSPVMAQFLSPVTVSRSSHLTNVLLFISGALSFPNILFAGMHKRYWHTRFLCFMVMARLITAYPSECSDSKSRSDKKGTTFCDRCENRCYVRCLVPLHTAGVNRTIITCFHLFGIGLRAAHLTRCGEACPWLQSDYHGVAGMRSSSLQPCRISNAMLCLLL